MLIEIEARIQICLLTIICHHLPLIKKGVIRDPSDRRLFDNGERLKHRYVSLKRNYNHNVYS